MDVADRVLKSAAKGLVYGNIFLNSPVDYRSTYLAPRRKNPEPAPVYSHSHVCFGTQLEWGAYARHGSNTAVLDHSLRPRNPKLLHPRRPSRLGFESASKCFGWRCPWLEFENQFHNQGHRGHILQEFLNNVHMTVYPLRYQHETNGRLLHWHLVWSSNSSQGSIGLTPWKLKSCIGVRSCLSHLHSAPTACNSYIHSPIHLPVVVHSTHIPYSAFDRHGTYKISTCIHTSSIHAYMHMRAYTYLGILHSSITMRTGTGIVCSTLMSRACAGGTSLAESRVHIGYSKTRTCFDSNITLLLV